MSASGSSVLTSAVEEKLMAERIGDTAQRRRSG
jgi:hypothetical protein